MAIFQEADPLRWLQCCGTAYIADATDNGYGTIHRVPGRIDLIDEARGWAYAKHWIFESRCSYMIKFNLNKELMP